MVSHWHQEIHSTLELACKRKCKKYHISYCSSNICLCLTSQLSTKAGSITSKKTPFDVVNKELIGLFIPLNWTHFQLSSVYQISKLIFPLVSLSVYSVYNSTPKKNSNDKMLLNNIVTYASGLWKCNWDHRTTLW